MIQALLSMWAISFAGVYMLRWGFGQESTERKDRFLVIAALFYILGTLVTEGK